MQSNLGKAALGVALAIAAMVLLIVLSNSNDDEPNGSETVTVERNDSSAGDGKPAGEDRSDGPGEAAIPTIVVKGGKPVGGVEELSYEAGERIRFRVRSDAADEIHVHGYDVEEEVVAGGSALFDFPATLEGIYEAELHGSGEQIAELRVEP